jgi:hypothetical protein
VQALLESDDLQGVAPGDVDGAFEHGYGAEGAAELVDLYLHVCVSVDSLDARYGKFEGSVYPVYQRPIPRLDKKRKLFKHSTQEIILKLPCIR